MPPLPRRYYNNASEQSASQNFKAGPRPRTAGTGLLPWAILMREYFQLYRFALLGYDDGRVVANRNPILRVAMPVLTLSVLPDVDPAF